MRAEEARPLVVDMDGTLLQTDMLFESFLRALKKRPWIVFLLPFWLLQGRAALKARLATMGEVDVDVLPFRQDVLAFLRSEKQGGRKIVLATASAASLARQVASALSVFDDVLASESGKNLKGQAKAALLVDRYGEKGFDYMGNDQADIPVWRTCHTVHVVSNNKQFVARAQKMGVQAGRCFQSGVFSLAVLARAFRVHQWVKNVLVFVPLLMAHRFHEPMLLSKAVLAYIAFCLCASSVYLLNDMMDIDDDRHHRSKKNRPIASGELPIVAALLLFPLLFVLGFGLALFSVSVSFAWLLGLYYALTLAYSFSLKRQMMIDVIVLAGLYTSRIAGGAFAINVELSFWLITFSVFVFLSLALVKRYAELLVLQGSGAEAIKGRGYCVDDLPTLLSLGTASAYLSVLVMALYLDTDKVADLYTRPYILWLLCPIMLYWIGRIWMITHRGQMHDDPIVFAIKDPVSRYTAVCMALTLFLAS
ncbi:MAG TPA: UbiA family prenyltransferase [Gammaproteobacteria bacterium]